MKQVYFVPFSESGLKNELFAPYWNSTANVPPFDYLKTYLKEHGFEAKTIDFWDGNPAETLIAFDHPPLGVYGAFYALREMLGGRKIFPLSQGELKNKLEKFKRKILFAWESPVNKPWMYGSASKTMLSLYDRVYSLPRLEGVSAFLYPQNFDTWSREHFNAPREKFMVMMNNRHSAKGFLSRSLYRERERAAGFFSRFGEIDIYGKGWGEVLGLKQSAKGSSPDKPETFSRYKFAVCFENAIWPGYLTEKIFDCFLVGTVPIYLGDPEVEKKIPKEAFIDMRAFGRDYGKLQSFLRGLSKEKIESYRDAARKFLESPNFKKFGKESFAEEVLRAITG